MSLDTWDAPSRIYLARGDEVSPHRPLFTGDVIADVAIPGVQERGPGLIVAHPCAMRRGPKLADQILMAAVESHDPVSAEKWATGYFDRMPLPELRGDGADFEAGFLGRVGLAASADIEAVGRVASLSQIGVNMLQQRMVFHLTRLEVPTAHFWTAFAYTYEEADLLEEWIEWAPGQQETSPEAFEAWIRAEDRQQRLQDPQQRASIRTEMRAELRRLKPDH